MSSLAEPGEVVGAAKAGHPKGLYALFATEMWERFSFYGMRALLVLYLTKALDLTRKDALGVYAVYTGLVYLTPLIGGRLADRYLGQRKAVFLGGILMAIGQFALTQPSLLDLGLGLLIVGNGFFKPNISTMVGTLYAEKDPRRDSAYTIFYMGINVGALAPLICSPLGERVGWGFGFGAAGVGMTFGILTFVFTQRLLLGGGLPPGREPTPDAVLHARDWLEIALGVVLGLGFVGGALQLWPYLRPLWSPSRLPGAISVVYKGAILIGLLVAFLYATEAPKSAKAADEAHRPLTAADWQRIAVILIVSLFSVVFWMGFEQSGGTLNLFADEKTNRVVFGYDIPASIFQAVNPVFIIALVPVFVTLWTTLDRRGIRLPSVAKQGIGLVVLSIAFGVMYLADAQSKTGKVSLLWLFAVYFLFTVAELCVSPIGLSLVNKLAPLKLASLMMATWFLCTAAANYLAGIMEHTIEPYHLNLWAFLGVCALVPGLLLLAVTPVLVKMSHGRM